MKIRPTKRTSAPIAAAFLALSLAMTAAYAEMAPMTPPAAKSSPSAPAAKPPKTTPRSNAQLQQEIDSLRAQVQQLQQAHGMDMSKQPGKGMPMPDSGGAMPPAEAPMKKDCMGMGCMEKGDDAMGMPPAEGSEPQPKPHM